MHFQTFVTNAQTYKRATKSAPRPRTAPDATLTASAAEEDSEAPALPVAEGFWPPEPLAPVSEPLPEPDPAEEVLLVELRTTVVDGPTDTVKKLVEVLLPPCAIAVMPVGRPAGIVATVPTLVSAAGCEVTAT